MSLEIRRLHSNVVTLKQKNNELINAEHAVRHPHKLALSVSALAIQDDRMRELADENGELRRIVSTLKEKQQSKHFTLNASESKFGYNIPELLRICRTIIAKKGVFTLTTAELQVVQRAVHTAAIHKDPIRKSEREISYDIEDGKEKIDYLQNELSDSQQVLKTFNKPSANFNNVFSTPMHSTQAQVYGEGHISKSKKVVQKPFR